MHLFDAGRGGRSTQHGPEHGRILACTRSAASQKGGWCGQTAVGRCAASRKLLAGTTVQDPKGKS